MPFLRSLSLSAALAGALLATAPASARADARTCGAAAARPSSDPRITLAIREAVHQHQLFGGQTVERNGGLFRVGHHEADWSRSADGTSSSWQQVALFWRSLSERDPPALHTSAGRVRRADVLASIAAAGVAPAAQTAVEEALMRSAIMDTPWSAAFISHLFKTAGFSGAEFAFSDRHVDYVQAALEATVAEQAGDRPTYAFRACDVATTRPRPGDLLCATRGATAGIVRLPELRVALAARAGQGFPMHCDLVVRADEQGDAKLETIGGNVLNSVTLTRMTLNARKVLGASYIRRDATGGECEADGRACREHLGRRPWLVLLQMRD